MRVEDGALTRTPREEGRPCLGSVCTVDGRSWKDTQHRVARAWRAFYALKMFLPGPAGLWQQATKLFERAIKPVVLYGSESRCPAVKDLNPIRVTHRKMFSQLICTQRWKEETPEDF
eukprot:4503108-Pyramimonas_sp.AAC.1